MNLKETIDQYLSRLQSPDRGPAREMVIRDDLGTFEARLVSVETIGCVFESAAFRCRSQSDVSIDELRRLSTSLAERLTYLLEPIRLFEADEKLREVQLRSTPPTTSERAVSYYELIVRPGEVAICRYEKPDGAARRIEPAGVTREVLHRLATDLRAAAAEMSSPVTS